MPDVEIIESDSDPINVEIVGASKVRASISHDGTEVLSEPVDINFTNALDVSDDNDNTVTVDVADGAIQLDELDLSITPTWTGQHRFDAGLDSRGNIVDDTTVIWDTSVGEVPDSALGTIDNATLANDAVTVTAGDSLTGGGSVSLGSSVTVDLGTVENSHLSNDNVTVAGNTVALGSSTTVSIDDLSDVSSATESAGQVPIWNATATEYQNASLVGGTEISITESDASITIDLDTPIDNADLANDSVTVAGNTVSLGSSTSLDHSDLSNIGEEDHHDRGGYSRADVTSTSTTASAWDSLWIDTSAAGAAVTVTLPADADVSDGDRVEVGVEDATNDTDVSPNTGQSVLGNNPTLTQVGDTLTFEYKVSNSTWMVR